MDVHGFVGFMLSKKFQMLKGRIKDWVKEVFGNIEAVRNNVVEVDFWDKEKESFSSRSGSLIGSDKQHVTFGQDRGSFRRQKSRTFWLKEGDKNTRSFYNMENMRRINHIGSLRRGGKVTDKPKDIKEEVATLFESLYKRENFPQLKLDGVLFPSISVETQSWLERVFDVAEVESAPTECRNDEAPGPNGFNFAFIKAGWEFLKINFMAMIMEFHSRGRLNTAINMTFVTLIPKVPDPGGATGL